MQIIEKFTQGKLNNERLNEDGYFISKDFVAVFNGASSFKEDTDTVFFSKSTGRVARDSVLKTFKNLTDSDKKLTKQEITNLLTTDLYNCLPKGREDFYNENKEYGLEISVVIFSNYHKELWLLGDSNIVINGKEYNLPMSKAHKDIIEERVGIVENRLLKEDYEEVYKTDNSFNDIKKSIHKQRNLANVKEGGYPVLTGFPINDSLTKTISLKEEDVVILTTDGYVKVKESLIETEKQLYKDLKEDPLCIKKLWGMKPHFKENSSFDDRTYVKFIV